MYKLSADKQPRPFLSHTSSLFTKESGFTLIELMIVVAVIGILAAIAMASYQTYVRQSQLITLYQEVNHFRMPYQLMVNESEGVTGFSPAGLNMPAQTQYCLFTITAPNVNGTTYNAIICQIQNLSYLQNQQLSLDRSVDGSWTCRASTGISTSYLPKGCQ